MEKKATPPPAGIPLPVLQLNLKKIKKPKKVRKIVFQFEVTPGPATALAFNLVAYPLYGKKKKAKPGIPVLLDPVPATGLVELDLPLTLGNLELNANQFRRLLKPGRRTLTFTPYRYEKNPHAAYLISDDSGLMVDAANPVPPGRPT